MESFTRNGAQVAQLHVDTKIQVMSEHTTYFRTKIVIADGGTPRMAKEQLNASNMRYI